MSKLISFFGCLLFALSGFGAEVEGVITDALTGETLPGATVLIKGTTRGVTANLEGYYILKNLPEGDVTLVTTFMGYADNEQVVTVTENLRYTQDFIMVKSTTSLTEFVISERATGQVKALKDQRDAANIVNVVSEEQIKSFPDLNAADALQRVPGISVVREGGSGKYVQMRGTPPSFTNINVNGVQLPTPETSIRAVGLDVINASQIQTLEVNKVLTPDMNGDAIGGMINIKTKRAESTEPTYNVVLAGGYNNLRGTPNGEMQFTFSQRKGRIGFLMNANHIYSEQGADNMEFKYDKGPFFGGQGPDNYYVQYREVQLRHYDVKQSRTGLSASLDFHLNENNRFYIDGMYNRFSDDEVRFRKIYTLDDATSERNYLYGGIEHDVKQREKIQTISTINAGGEHDFGWAKLNFEAAYSLAVEDQPNRLEAVFENPGQAIQIKFDMSDPDFPIATFPDEDNAQNAYDYENYEMDQLLLRQVESRDENIVGRFDLEIPVKKGFLDGMFKVGALYRTKDKSADVHAQSFGAYREQSNLYPLPGEPLNLNTVNDGFYEDNFLDRGYVLEAMPDPELMRNFYQRYPTLFVYGDKGITETLFRTYTEDYTATEDVQAYYAMTEQNFGKLMVLAGVRYERTDITYETYEIRTNNSGYFQELDSVRDSRTVDFLLPNIQLRYQLRDDLNIRAAYTHSYVRPNFRDILPYRTTEGEEVKEGNPNLNYPLAKNVDFLVEKYWGGRNMLSGGVFYKRIDEFVFNYKVFAQDTSQGSSNIDRVEYETPRNGISADVAGLELQLMTFFDFLPGKLKNIGVQTNYTYSYSEAKIQKRYPGNEHENGIFVGGDSELEFVDDQVEIIDLPGQSPHVLNVALFYDSPKWYFKISANYSDVFLSTLGVDPDMDEYYGEQWRFDMNGYYQINQNLQVFGDIRNFTNSPSRYYLGAPENRRIQQTEYYSFWARMGVRLTF